MSTSSDSNSMEEEKSSDERLPKRQKASGDNVVDLTEDATDDHGAAVDPRENSRVEDEEDRKPAAKMTGGAVTAEANDDDRKPAAVTQSNDVGDDASVEEVSGPLDSAATEAKGSAGGGDDDVQFLKSTGPLATADYPHSREHCSVHPFCKKESEAESLSATKNKQFCGQCYCMVCDKPASKCKEWIDNSHCHATYGDSKWREERERRKRSTQQQSSGYSHWPSYTPYYVQLTTKNILDAATRIYPSERKPPKEMFATDLLHYQRQGLAFMLDIEEKTSVKSGWLCSEVGMGKSAIVVALIASNPLPKEQWPTEETCKNARFKKKTDDVKAENDMVDVKATVIFTTKSLLGQWEDEISKHAPGLVIKRHFSDSKMKLVDLASADVIVTAATKHWSDAFTTRFRYRRVVVDESHLIGSTSMKYDAVDSIISDRTWCISATPFAKGDKGIQRQIELMELNQERFDLGRKELYVKYMLRHTKSMLIGGSEALTLPPSTTKTVMLDLDEDERARFEDIISAYHGFPRDFYAKSQKLAYVEMKWYSMMASFSKTKRLLADIEELLTSNPNLRSVIFTHFKQQQDAITSALYDVPNMAVYKFNGSSDSKRRDKLIREFQDHQDGPACFVMTIKTGSCGITLTNATNVFLMEPCLNPSQEVQAAGRIHRLGQDKPVETTKYIFSDTLESQVHELHKEIAECDASFFHTFFEGEQIKADAMCELDLERTYKKMVEPWRFDVGGLRPFYYVRVEYPDGKKFQCMPFFGREVDASVYTPEEKTAIRRLDFCHTCDNFFQRDGCSKQRCSTCCRRDCTSSNCDFIKKSCCHSCKSINYEEHCKFHRCASCCTGNCSIKECRYKHRACCHTCERHGQRDDCTERRCNQCCRDQCTREDCRFKKWHCCNEHCEKSLVVDSCTNNMCRSCCFDCETLCSQHKSRKCRFEKGCPGKIKGNCANIMCAHHCKECGQGCRWHGNFYD